MSMVKVVEIIAESGDLLYLFALKSSNPELSSDFIELVVP